MPTDRDPADGDARVTADVRPLAAHDGPAASDHGARHPSTASAMHVRSADLEPYVGLRYVAKLFRLIAILLLLSLIAAVIQNGYLEGTKGLVNMIPEASQLLVMTGLLWGAGDLALLLIDIGHDVRATRILIGRQTAHHEAAAATPPPVSNERRSSGRGVGSRE